jgi:glycine/D-amino acid oxidase-like deaminating enzyme
MWPFRRSFHKQAAASVRTARPYWLLRDGIGDGGPRLDRSLDCDVAIIGAGVVGALVADALIATGRRVILLDRHEAGQASTAASTALLQYEIDTHLTDLIRLRGANAAAQAYLACVSSFAKLEGRFPELLPQCDYRREPSVYVASEESAVPDLRAELAARRAIGIQAEWLEGDALRARYGIHREGAIVSALAATIDPLRLTRGVLAGCVRHGAQLFTHAEVLAIEEQGEGLVVRLAAGHAVSASHVVVAAGYESLKFLPVEVADIDNTFALVTEPLGEPRRAALPQIWESARPYLYMRGTPDGRLLLGGADVPFRSAAAREVLLPRQLAKLAAAYEKLFELPLPPIAYGWAGSFGKTSDGLPFIGRVPGLNPRLQFALCFGGNGITYAAHAGDMIRAGIEGDTHPLETVFGFQRLGTELASGGADRKRAGGVAAS